MRDPNFKTVSQNKAAITVNQHIYDRRALDCTSDRPLVNYLNHLTFLTGSAAKVRETLSTDGGVERLVNILHECYKDTDRELGQIDSMEESEPCPVLVRGPSEVGVESEAEIAELNPELSTFTTKAITREKNDALIAWKWTLTFQCLVLVGTRGTEEMRRKVVQAGVVPVIATILDNYLLFERNFDNNTGSELSESFFSLVKSNLPDSSSIETATASANSENSQQHYTHFPSEDPELFRYLNQTLTETNPSIQDNVIASPRKFLNGILIPKDDDVIWALQLLAFISKYPNLKSQLQNTFIIDHLSLRSLLRTSEDSQELPPPLDKDDMLDNEMDYELNSNISGDDEIDSCKNSQSAPSTSTTVTTNTTISTVPSSSTTNIRFTRSGINSNVSFQSNNNSNVDIGGFKFQLLNSSSNLSENENNENLHQPVSDSQLNHISQSNAVKINDLINKLSKKNSNNNFKNNSNNNNNNENTTNELMMNNENIDSINFNSSGSLNNNVNNNSGNNSFKPKSDKTQLKKLCFTKNLIASIKKFDRCCINSVSSPASSSISSAESYLTSFTSPSPISSPQMVSMLPESMTTTLTNSTTDTFKPQLMDIIMNEDVDDDIEVDIDFSNKSNVNEDSDDSSIDLDTKEKHVKASCWVELTTRLNKFYNSKKVSKKLESIESCKLQKESYNSKWNYSNYFQNENYSNNNANEASYNKRLSDSQNKLNIFPLVEKFTTTYKNVRDMCYWSGVIMRNSCKKDESRGGVRQCGSFSCGKWETVPREFAKCRRCKRSKYCSKQCQLDAWDYHKYWCIDAATNENPHNLSSKNSTSHSNPNSSTSGNGDGNGNADADANATGNASQTDQDININATNDSEVIRRLVNTGNELDPLPTIQGEQDEATVNLLDLP